MYFEFFKSPGKLGDVVEEVFENLSTVSSPERYDMVGVKLKNFTLFLVKLVSFLHICFKKRRVAMLYTLA
jgi:hypothetical protein